MQLSPEPPRPTTQTSALSPAESRGSSVHPPSSQTGTFPTGAPFHSLRLPMQHRAHAVVQSMIRLGGRQDAPDPLRPHERRSMNHVRLAVVTALATLAGACGRPTPPPAPAPVPPAPPPAVMQYAALPDTVICVVDRTTDRGLRDLQAKRGPNGGVVL